MTVDGNVTSGAALAPDQLGFVDPHQCPLTALSWTGGCGTSPGSTLTCPSGTSTVSVAASSNGFGYSDPVELQIVVTDYAVEVTPAVVTLAPGGTSRHLVTVVAQGGAFGSEVALSCATASLPPQTTCEFDPPTVVPGAAGGRSTLTVTTAASAVAASAARAQPAPRLGTRAVGSGIAVFPASLTFATQIVSTSAPPQLVHATNIGIDVLALRASPSPATSAPFTPAGSRWRSARAAVWK